ncbi:MAG: hypothetical protein PVJ57_09710 [Phycisphaerae bacterium]|jgi:hypothetical protein
MTTPDDQPEAVHPPTPWAVRDVAGLIVQVALSLLGLHVMLAVGFTLHWGTQAIADWRHPAAGLAVLLAGAWLRWLLSPRFRDRCMAAIRRQTADVRAYAAGQRAPAWRAAFWWVFVPVLVIYQSNGRTLGSGDTAPMVQTALSIVHDGDLALDEFIDVNHPPYYVCDLDGHHYSRFSLGPAVLAVPWVALNQVIGGDLSDPTMRQRMEKVIASVLAAATVAVMFLVLLRITDLGPTAFLMIVFALATPTWSIASQALWQHGPVALCVAAVLWLHYARPRADGATRPQCATALEQCASSADSRHEREFLLAALLQGVFLGLAVACRPTAALFAAAYILATTGRNWCRLATLVAGAALAYAPFLTLHLSIYGSVLGPYAFAGEPGRWGADLAVSLPGNLISPARGLLVYVPLSLLVIGACVPAWHKRIGGRLSAALLAWLLVHLIVVSCYRHWWGGHAWGPRFLTELMPAVIVLMSGVVAALWRVRPARVLLIVLAAWSVGLQGFGVYSPAAQRWMKSPVDIDLAPERLWDWSDAPFLHPWRDRNEPNELRAKP